MLRRETAGAFCWRRCTGNSGELPSLRHHEEKVDRSASIFPAKRGRGTTRNIVEGPAQAGPSQRLRVIAPQGRIRPVRLAKHLAKPHLKIERHGDGSQADRETQRVVGTVTIADVGQLDVLFPFTVGSGEPETGQFAVADDVEELAALARRLKGGSLGHESEREEQRDRIRQPFDLDCRISPVHRRPPSLQAGALCGWWRGGWISVK